MQPTFSLAYTTCRPHLIPYVIEKWLSHAANRETIEVVVCVDEPLKGSVPPAIKNFVVQNEAPFNCVRGWNKAVEATTGKVIICVADDFEPPLNWDTSLLELSPTDWIDGDHIVHTEDGYVHDIAVLSILTRKRYERYGYVFYPRYESMFCDTEFTQVAARDGVVIQAKHLLFEHMHPDCGKRPRDNNDLVHGGRERWNRGEMLFNYRKQNGFPVDDGPKAVVVDESAAPSGSDLRYAVYIQATRDDFCLFEVCKRMIDEGVRDFFFSIPDEYWSGAVTPRKDIDEVLAVREQLQKHGARAHYQIVDVSRYRFPGDSRIAVETRVRNDALAWIRKNGFSHTLIVDGDELWTTGMLAKVTEIVQTAKPACISCPMVPVVGLPGYPINNATDRAIVYIDGTNVFRECRSPAVEHYMLNSAIVIHFTATRRTMEEIVEKHRNSGHYDDPEYDFEGWINNTLPNLKPGARNAHMYRRYQIWPEVRNWTHEEMWQIPSSLHQYLGRPVEGASPISHALRPSTKQLPQRTQKVTPFRLNQVETFVGHSLNPYRR